MMLLRARTLAMGHSGARPVVAERDARAAQRRHHAGGARARLARRERRPRPARPLRAGADRRGRGRGPDGAPGPRRCSRRRDRADHAGAEGGPRADQRHRRDARDAGAGARRPRAACCASPTSPPRCRSRRCSAPTARSPRTCIALRPQPGQAASAANLRRLLAGSPIVASHRYGDDRVQDAYSLRCAPQVTGAARDTLAHAERVAAAELGERDRQPDGAARRAGRVVRQLPRRAARLRAATSWRSPSRRSAGSPSGAPTGCSTPPARTACRRSSAPEAGRQLRAA